jgi:hypothetical protein
VLHFLFGVATPASVMGGCGCGSARRWRAALRWTCRAGLLAGLATATVALAVIGSRLADHLH